MERLLKRLATLIVLLGLANGFVAAVAALVLGGTATTGKIEDGRHFLEHRGSYTEVSRPVWMYSKIHVTSVELSAPLVLIGLLTLAYGERRRRRRPAGRPAAQRTGPAERSS